MIETGQKFGRWTVLQKAPSRRTPGGYTLAYWLCRCECGTESEVMATHMRSGRSASCGCLQAEVAAKTCTRHGFRKHPLHEVWSAMLARCENPRNKRFASYGGRGIKVCDRWRDFAAFIEDVLPGYEPGLTLDRIDNDGDYEPANCRWATHTQQARNQRKTVRVQWQGETVALAELASRHGVRVGTAYVRYQRKGWSVAQAIGQEARL